MLTIQRKRVEANDATYVTYNDYLTLIVDAEGKAAFEYHSDNPDRLEWSIWYPSEAEADDAYCGRDIEWQK